MQFYYAGMKNIKISRKDHKNEMRLFLEFEYDKELIALTKSLPDAIWSQTNKAWHVPDESGMKNTLFATFKGKAWLDFTAINDTAAAKKSGNETVKTNAPRSALPELPENSNRKTEDFVSWMRSKRYSERTIKTYKESISLFLRYFADKPVEEIENRDLVKFNNEYILKNKYSSSFQNQVVNAVKLFFSKVENRQLDIELIHRPKREHRLPNVLSKNEIQGILKASQYNIKHHAMLSLIYSCGLRRSELINLTPADVDAERGLLIIRNAKGKKDRVVPLSQKTIILLRECYKENRTEKWLFEGWKKGEKYSDRSLEEVLKKSIKLAGINKPVTLHWLRHSYATHLLEAGVDLRYIQELLGHKSSRTTEIYTHVSTKQLQQIKSPFDDLDL